MYTVYMYCTGCTFLEMYKLLTHVRLCVHPGKVPPPPKKNPAPDFVNPMRV